MSAIQDFVVVGSGCTGAMAAQTLIEAGASVTMVDVGVQDEVYKDIVPDKDFVSVRESDSSQHRYFLGDQFEGIPWNDIRVGAQLTPPRQFIQRDVEKWLPFISDSFKPMESMAYGGLGSGWGLGCYVFSPAEVEALGLKEHDMEQAYEVVSRRIGISAKRDDGTPFGLGTLDSFDPALRFDENMSALYQRYNRMKPRLNAMGFHMGQPPMAIISQDHEERAAYSYKDMDFWTDKEQSAYRPWITVNRLRKNPHFQYRGGSLALAFREVSDGVELTIRRTDTSSDEIIQCRRLVLAAGALGTARIALRSVQGPAPRRLSILCNPYYYIPTLQWRMLGKVPPRLKTSMSQLVIYYDPDEDGFDVSIASLYTYRSLLLYKLVKEAPLNFADGLKLMQMLQSSFVIAGIFLPERPGSEKFIELEQDSDSQTGDRLKVAYKLTGDEQRVNLQVLRNYERALRKLGCFPIRRINPGAGSSIHYGGTLPYENDNRPYSLDTSGRLHGTQCVWVADGSGFRYLPGKGLTLTLMANAHRVARHCFESVPS